MALRGDLASVDLAQVFQMLALNKKVGLLSVQSAKLWKVLYFDHRGVTVYHNVHQVLDRVVAAFLRTGRLTEAAVDEVRDHAARMGQALADSLLAGGYLEAAELEDQYRAELDEEIYDLFFCRDAKFEFHEGATTLDGREGTVDERFFSNCDSVVMEAARRIDEWTYISERVPTTAEVLVATVDAIDAEAFGTDGTAVFHLLDGRRNVARVVEITGLSNFLVCKVLSQLLDANAVAPVDPAELPGLAAGCFDEGRLRDAISLYERAIELGVGLPDAHSHVAKAYQAAEEYEHAIYHLECEAEHRLGAGDRPGAAKCLFEVRALVPTALQARDRLVELTLGPGGVKIQGFDPLAEGKELVDLMVEFGDVQRVRALLERLLLVAPDDPDLKKALVNVHVKAGDQKRIVELYESIADDLVRQQKPLEAVAYLQKVLLIDRSRGDVSERVRKLYEFDERSRKRGRALGVLGVVFCVLLLLGSAYWFYNERAEEEFARIDVREMVEREDFAGATTVFDEFVAGHPLTTAVAKANAELQRVEVARQQFEARRDSERANRERETKRLRDEYKAEWGRHRELFLAGRPEESLVALTRVRDLIGSTPSPEDAAWGLEQQVERTWIRLREFLAEAEKLGTDYDRRLAAGEWEAARIVALKLLSDFENTAAARRAKVPVQVVTRPAGATLAVAGTVLVRKDGAADVPMTTPAIVLLGREPVQVVASRDGFEPRAFVVDAKTAAVTEVVLEVLADRRITFDAPVQTGVGMGDGWLAVGLRGGRLGLARTDGSNRHMRELSGLKAVDSTPHVQGGRVFFLSNENTIESLALDRTGPVAGWPVSLASGAATELTVAEGRVAVVDRDNVLHCWEQASGHQVFAVALDSLSSGAPSIDRRQVHVGTADGRVLVFDAVDGRALGVLRSPAAITTRVLAERGQVFFGSADGNVRAVDIADGRVVWTAALGRTPNDADIALGKGVLLAIGAKDSVVAIDRDKGLVTGTLSFDGEVQSGIRLQGARALVQVRRGKSRTKPAHDVLVAIEIDKMAIAWEFVDAGLRPGLPGLDDLTVAMPSAAGEVILFR
ncbi:MAG: PQQ-binding-like beta-propeller repeat protein [Planctomycetes bacterium]|nr:PQQ-binding-like beta-propeller repeat protein [Planctomycetota bacterium]